MDYQIIKQNNPQIISMVCDMCKELGLDFNKTSITHSLNALFTDADFVCYGLIDNDKIVGVIAFYLHFELFNFQLKCASEQFFYVLPSHRGHGLRLLRHAENALPKGTRINLGTALKKRINILQRLGYSQDKILVTKEV